MKASVAGIALWLGAVGQQPPATVDPHADAQALSRVGVVFSGDWPENLRSEVIADLRAELSHNDVAIVEIDRADSEESREEWLAVICLHAAPAARFVIGLEVNDEATSKRVARDVDVSGVPGSAWSLSLTISAVELLEASWAELALRSRQAETSASPPVTRTAEDPGPAVPQPELSHRLDLGALVLGSLGGVVFMGGAARYEVWPRPRLGTNVGIGGGAMLPVRRDGDTVHAGAYFGSVSVLVGLAHRPRFRLDAAATSRIGAVSSRGVAGAMAVGHRSTNPIVELSLGLRPAVRAGPVWMYGRAALGAVVVGVDFLRSDTEIARYNGLALDASLGVLVELGPRKGRRAGEEGS